MTADQQNRLIEHAKQLLADPKWMKAALPETRAWAAYWARATPRKAVKAIPA